MELRDHIRALLARQKLSIRGLSAISGVRRQSITAFLAGANIHLDNLQKLLAALGQRLTLGPLAVAAQTLAQERLAIDRRRLRTICRRYGIRRVALFGSVLRPEFSAKSDIDILVQFGKTISLFEMAALEEELATVFPKGRQLDVVTEQALSPHFRGEVLAECEVVYEEAA